MFDISVVFPYFPQLLIGVLSTLAVSLSAIVIGLILGWLIFLGLNSPRRLVRCFCKTYVSFYRGTPLLVQLILIFYALPTVGITLSPLLAAVVALSLNTAAFQGEILRAGFKMLPKGQLEAARDFGFSAAQTLFYIQMPQVLRAMMPALINETIDIIKNSALVSVVAVHELMRVTQTLASTTYRPLEFYTACGLLYFLTSWGLSIVGTRLEKNRSSSAQRVLAQ